MTLTTKLTERLGIRLPILQAPMGGGIAGPELVTAASNAGGLGILPIWTMPAKQAARELETVRRSTAAPFGVNVNVGFGPETHIELALAHSVPVIHFFWGDATPFISRAKSAGAIVLATVGSSTEARHARAAGADVLIAQGLEAGGHVWGNIGLHALVPAVVDAADGVPVVAAGGIGDGRTLASAFTLGASGAIIGTALVVAEESGAHQEYKAAILKASDGDTVFGTLFDVGWPNAPCRVLRNSTVEAWERAGSPPSGGRPNEGETVAHDEANRPIPRYSAQPPSRGVAGNIESMAMYAGQGVGLIKRAEPAAAIISRLVQDSRELLCQP